MRISVIIPCYNSGSHLARTLESALAQTLPPLEILCVDDCSTDGTWELIASFESRSNGRVRGIRHAANSGTPAISRNTGIRAAKGDWIAFVDHDDLWQPEKLERQARLLEQHPAAEALHGNFWEEWDDDPATRRLMHDPAHPPPEMPFPAMFFKNLVVCHAMVVRRGVFDSVGFMTDDPRKRGSTDFDMWLRMAHAGCRFAYCAEPLGVHRRHGTNLSRNFAWHLRGKLTVLEDFLRTNPDARRAIGAAGIRARLLSERLRLAYCLLEEGNEVGAREELRKAWSIAGPEIHIWRLRAMLALRGLKPRREARRIKHIADRFRKRTLGLARKHGA